MLEKYSTINFTVKAVVTDSPMVAIIEPACVADFINECSDEELGKWLRDCLSKLDGKKS